MTVQVDATKTHQTIEGFGTMWTFWAWLPQYNDPAFFDRVVNDLGVSLVRVEIPASLEGVNDDADPHHYNWPGFNLGPDMDRLMRFCQEFKKRGVTRFLGDTFSPPGFMKTNRAVNWGGNIRADMWDEYAEFMSAFIILAQKDYGINITDITIQNELLFIEWYASCVYHPDAAREAVRALMRRFKAENIHCNILMPEDMMQYDRMMAYIAPTMADPETKDFQGAFCTHRLGGYDVVHRWAESTKQYGRQSWMTETSGHPQNWVGAMKMASDIYDYIVGGNFSVWVYLRLTVPSGGGGLMVNGKPGPKYYAAKQWYRYVRPGAVRVDADELGPERARGGVHSGCRRHDDGGAHQQGRRGQGAHLRRRSGPAAAVHGLPLHRDRGLRGRRHRGRGRPDRGHAGAEHRDALRPQQGDGQTRCAAEAADRVDQPEPVRYRTLGQHDERAPARHRARRRVPAT